MRSRQDERRRSWRKHRAPQIHRGSAHRAWILGGRKKQGEKRQRQPHACGSVSRASLHDEELRRRVRVSRVAGAYQVRLRSGRRMKDVLLDFSRR